MLISKEELENLERYEASQARRSARSIQEVLESTFEERNARPNPPEITVKALPFEKLSREEAQALVLDQLRRFFRADGKSESEADEVYERAKEKMLGQNPDFDLGKVVQDLTDVTSSQPNLTTVYNSFLIRKDLDPKNDTYLPENVVNSFVEALYPIIVRNDIAGFVDTLLQVDEGFSGKMSERRKKYRIFSEFDESSLPSFSLLKSELRQRRKIFFAEVYASIEFNGYDWFDDTLRKGLLYLCGRLLTLNANSPNYLFLQVIPENSRFLEQTLPSLLQVTADYWSRFKSFEDVIAFTTDPDLESQRVVVDKTLTLIAARFIGRGNADFEKWYVAVGFSGFKRMLPLVEEILIEEMTEEILVMRNVFSHESAGILLTSFALLQMPAKQLKGYSKKLKAKLERNREYREANNVVRLGNTEGLVERFREIFRPSVSALREAKGESEGRFFPFQRALAVLVNSVSGSAGLFLSFAQELHQKAGGSLTFDAELLSALGLMDAGEETAIYAQGIYEREIALCAAILAALPAAQYDEIPNLKSRNFDYLQKKISDFLKTRPSLTGESLIEFYLAPREDISEMSYLNWCSAVFDVFKAAEGAESWSSEDVNWHDISNRLLKFEGSDGTFLQVFLESSEPTLNQRDFESSVKVRHDGGGAIYGISGSDLADVIHAADAYRRLHLGIGGNVDETLHPTWHEVLPAEGLYFVGLPRFHPLWWIIGSVSIANCCMTPDSVGKTSSRSGFWGNRDRSFLVVHKPSSTIIGSIQAIGIRLGTKGPWELAFDGFEKRNSQRGDSTAQREALERFLITKPFYNEPQVQEWMRENIPYLPSGTHSDQAFSGYIDYSDDDDFDGENFGSEAVREIQGSFVTISDITTAYRDFARAGTTVYYVGPNPPNMGQILSSAPDFSNEEFDHESFFENYRFPPDNVIRGTTFFNCSLVGASFEGCTLNEINFIDCNLERVNFTGATLEFMNFEDCNLRDANFDRASLNTVTIQNEDGRGAGLRGASFKDATLEFVDFAAALNWDEALHLDEYSHLDDE